MTKAVLSTLKSSNLLKEINNTVITLILKFVCPNVVGEFRPLTAAILSIRL